MTKEILDVGFHEDLMYGLKNLTSAENHCIESYTMEKEENPDKANDFLQANMFFRKLRSKYLKYLVDKGNNQAWCISKHSLAVVMALQEIGNRFASEGKYELSREAFDDAIEVQKVMMVLNNIGVET